MILHAEEDSVEVNVASNSNHDDLFFDYQIATKERELMYQKIVLLGCKKELESLKQQIQEETDPEERFELMLTASKFALTLAGKKEKFIASYEKWKTSMVKMDLMQAA